MTERDLILRLKEGDHEAFDVIFRESYAELVGCASRLLRDEGTAEEVVQEVMLELWRRREELSVRESLRGYLFRATRNRALNHLRHEKVVLRSAPLLRTEVTAQPASSESAARELEEAVREAIATLPPRCREVFELSRGQGLKYSEIAVALEISVKTVEAQMGKALRLLRERLAEWLPGEHPG